MSYPGQYQSNGASAPGYAPQESAFSAPQPPANGLAVYDPAYASQAYGSQSGPYGQQPYGAQTGPYAASPYAQQGQPYGGQGGAYGSGYYMPSPQERSEASMVQYLAIVLGWIAPLIYWGPERSPFVRHHARQAMNISLTYLIASTVIMVIGLPILMILAFATLGLGVILMMFLPLMALYPLIAHIMGGSKASNGEWTSSMAIQFFK